MTSLTDVGSTYTPAFRDSAPPARLETVRIGGLPTVTADRRELAEWMALACRQPSAVRGDGLPVIVFSSNGQGIALQGSNAAYDAAMAAADVIHADGMPVVLASRLFSARPIRGRSATTDLFHDVARVAVRDGLRFYMLGASEAQNEAAVAAIRALYPDLRIVGRRNGYFTEADEPAVCAEIVAAGTDVLWVALGKPKQEIWCARNRHRLAGVGAVKTCGGLYAFLTGDAPRAPDWMQRTGMEWCYRLWREPRRLFRRYMVTNAQALFRIALHSGNKK